MRPSIDARELEDRAERHHRRAAAGRREPRRARAAARPWSSARRCSPTATSSTSSAAAASACANGPCCATTRARIQHLLAPRRPHSHPLMLDTRLEGVLPHPRRQSDAQAPRVPLRHADSPQLRPPLHRRRDRRGGDRRRARASKPAACTLTLDYLGESVASIAEADAATRAYVALIEQIARAGDRAQPLAQAHAARSDRRSRDVRRQPAPRFSTPRTTHEFFVRIDMEDSAVHRRHARHLRDDVAAGISQRRRRAAVVPASQRRGRAAA